MRPWPLRYLAAVIPLLLLALGVWLTLEAAAQDPAKKPPRKEEQEEEPGKVKKKAPLRVDDEDEPRRPTGDTSATLRPADLAAEARKATHSAVRELLMQLAVPHDVAHWTAGRGRTDRIEPFPRRITPDTKSSFKKNELLLYKQEDDGRRGATIPVRRSEVKQIDAYEEIALGLIRKFVDAKGSVKSLPRVEVLRIAERALGTVVRYHEAARLRNERDGDDDWEGLVRQLRDELLRIQIDLVGALAEAKDWDQAYAAAAKLAQTSKRTEVRAKLAQHLSQFLLQALQEQNYEEARRRMRLLEELLASNALTGKVAEALSRKAADLMQQANREKDPVKAVAVLKAAESIWPRLPGLRDEILKRSKAYPILYVGVRDLPENLSPAAACTDVERQAVELLFESLIKPIVERGLGQRYTPELAEDRPRLIPLGREFHLARDAFWSNGTPVTAVDVRATVNLLKAKYPTSLLDEARIGADPFRVSITLRQGFLEPLSLMAFKIVPESAHLERLDDAKFARQPIGSGPFMLQGREKETVRFVANHNYRRHGQTGLPRIREVIFYRPKAPAADFASGRLDLLLDPEAIAQVRRTARVNVQALPNQRVYFLAINHRQPLLQNVDLRRALALAIDRGKILDDAFRGDMKNETPPPHRSLISLFPCGTWACKADGKTELCSPDVAKLLAEKVKDAVQRGKLTLKYPDNDGRVTLACQAIRDQVRGVGLDLQLEPRSPAQLRREVEFSHDYDLAYYHHDFESEAFPLWSLFDPHADALGPGGSNYLGYQNDSALQTALQKALLHRDFDEVRNVAHRIHGLLCEKMPLIPLWQLDTLIAIHADLKTYPAPSQLDPLRIFTDVERWELMRGQ